MNLRKYTEITIVAVLAFGLAATAESSLTIYNQNFAVVREPLPLDLQAGDQRGERDARSRRTWSRTR